MIKRRTAAGRTTQKKRSKPLRRRASVMALAGSHTSGANDQHRIVIVTPTFSPAERSSNTWSITLQALIYAAKQDGKEVVIVHTSVVPVSTLGEEHQAAAIDDGVTYTNIFEDIPVSDDLQVTAFHIFHRVRHIGAETVIFFQNLELGYYCALAKVTGLAFRDVKLIAVRGSGKEEEGRRFPSSIRDIAQEFMIKEMERLVSATLTLEEIGFGTGLAPLLYDNAPFELTSLVRYSQRGQLSTHPNRIYFVYLTWLNDSSSLNQFLRIIRELVSTHYERLYSLGIPRIIIGGPLNSLPLGEDIQALVKLLDDWTIEWELMGEITYSDIARITRRYRTVVPCFRKEIEVVHILELIRTGCKLLCPLSREQKDWIGTGASQAIDIPEADSDIVSAMFTALREQHSNYHGAGLDDRARTSWDILRTRIFSEVQEEIAPPTIALPQLTPRVEISVCMPTYNRRVELFEAIRSLEAQELRNFELILVDDGSDDPTAIDLQKRLIERCSFPAQRIVQSNNGPSAARNIAAAHARGDYLLFMDDDNVALPHETSTFTVAARHSGADVLTCAAGIHPRSEWGLDSATPVFYQRRESTKCYFWGPPLGACLSVGLDHNCFGDTNALIKRTAYEELGGFTAFMYEDLELYTRAILQGKRLIVVPEILYLYRFHRGSRSRREKVSAAAVESLIPILETTSELLWPALLLLRGQLYRRASEEMEQALTENQQDWDGIINLLEARALQKQAHTIRSLRDKR